MRTIGSKALGQAEGRFGTGETKGGRKVSQIESLAKGVQRVCTGPGNGHRKETDELTDAKDKPKHCHRATRPL